MQHAPQKNENPRLPPTPFFLFLGIVTWSIPWAVLDEQYVKTRVLAQGGALRGFRKINISVFTPKIAKTPNFRALSIHFLSKTKMLLG